MTKKWFIGGFFFLAAAAGFSVPGVDLFNAVKADDPEKVMRVLAGGVDNVNWKNKTGTTALIEACLNGNLEVVQTLLRYGASVTDIDDAGWYPVLAACASGNVELTDLVASLDQSRITLGVVGHGGVTPLSLAASKNNKVLYQLLVKYGAPKAGVQGAGTADELMTAAAANAVPILELIKAEGMRLQALDPNGQNALHFAAASTIDCLDAGKWLLANGVGARVVDADGKTPAVYAVAGGRLDLAKELLKASVGPVPLPLPSNEWALAVAVNAVDLLDALKAGGLNPQAVDANGQNALHYVCQTDGAGVDLLKWFLAAKVDPNLVDGNGKTPLFYAAEKDKLDVVRELLKAGARIGVVDKTKKRAADYAKNPDVVKLLK